MLIAYVKLSSKAYGDEDEFYITDAIYTPGDEVPQFEVPYNTKLADEIFKAAVTHQPYFHLEGGTEYQLLEYEPENKKVERQFNKYRSDPMLRPPINLIKHKNIVIYVVNGQTACETKHKTTTLRVKVLTSDKKRSNHRNKSLQ